jgi:hypothetical protein
MRTDRYNATVKAGAEGKLKCAECGGVVGGSETKSWAAYLTIDNEVEIYCPQCAEREFGAEAPDSG